MQAISIKKVLWILSLVCAVLALINRLVTQAFTKPAATGAVCGLTSYDAIYAYVERQMRHLKMPGISLVIVHGDRIAPLRGFGQDCPDGKAPISKIPFFVGSLTKSITAPNLPIAHGSLPSGQLISSAEDMAHYLIAHLDGAITGHPGAFKRGY
jgi:CubicO group peptidase (beta-lactamase class C family)